MRIHKALTVALVGAGGLRRKAGEKVAVHLEQQDCCKKVDWRMKLYTRVWEVVNEKGLPFPVAMLVRTMAYPHSLTDARRIQESIAEHGKRSAEDHRKKFPRVRLAGRYWNHSEGFAAEQWEQLGWPTDQASETTEEIGDLELTNMPIIAARGRARDSGLSNRQREVLIAMADGKASKEIAAMLKISVRTVEFHRAAVMQRLGLKSLAQLTKYAIDQGWL